MKHVIVLLAFLLPAGVFSQSKSKVLNYLDNNKYSLSSMFVAGTLDGTVEILRHDYGAFKRVFPNANDEFWNSEISWQNKWEGGERANGEKFLGSSTMFAWTTDGYHLLRTGQKAFIVTGVVFKIGGPKRKWTHYALDFVTHSVAYSLGFNFSYEVVFNH